MELDLRTEPLYPVQEDRPPPFPCSNSIGRGEIPLTYFAVELNGGGKFHVLHKTEPGQSGSVKVRAGQGWGGPNEELTGREGGYIKSKAWYTPVCSKRRYWELACRSITLSTAGLCLISSAPF